MNKEENRKKITEAIIRDLVNGEDETIVAKKYSITLQEIKANLVRSGDEHAKELVLRIIENQIPQISEITEKFLNGKAANTLANEYELEPDKLRRLIYEYSFFIGKEKEYEKVKNRNTESRYKPRFENLRRNQNYNTYDER